jgi:phosphoserine phosphatase RsbU/P
MTGPQRNPDPAFVPTRREGHTLRAIAAAVGLSAAIAIIDAQATGRSGSALGLLAAVPFVVAAFAGISGVVLGGCIATGTAAMMADYEQQPFDRPSTLVVLAGIAAATLTAAVIAAVKRRRLRQLDRSRVVAAVVQQTLLRPLPAAIGDVRIVARYSSATRGAVVGGDIYEAVASPFGTRVLVGDVRGKGLPAIHLGNDALGAFREWAHEAATITDLAAHLDASVARNAGPEDFVTALIVEIGERTVDIVNCGHPAPLLIAGDEIVVLAPSQPSLPLGLGVTAAAQRQAFDADARLLLYTDGVSDARRRGKFFDVADQAAAFRAHEPDEFVAQMHRKLTRFTRGKLNDDVAIVLLVRNAAGGADEPTPIVDALFGQERRPSPAVDEAASVGRDQPTLR